MNILNIIRKLTQKKKPIHQMELRYEYNEFVRFNVDERVYLKFTDKGLHHMAQVRTAAIAHNVPFRAVTEEDLRRLQDDEGYINMRMVDFMIMFGSIISSQDGPDYFDPFIRIKPLNLHA